MQTKDAYRALAEDGVLRSDPTRHDADLNHAYPWMRRMADQRLSTTGGTLLWLRTRIRRRDLWIRCAGRPAQSEGLSAGGGILDLRRSETEMTADRMTTFRIPGGLTHRLDDTAAREGSDRSAMIREVLDGIASGRIEVGAEEPDTRVNVRVDGEVLARATERVVAARGSERRLNAVVTEALIARVERAEKPGK